MNEQKMSIFHIKINQNHAKGGSIPPKFNIIEDLNAKHE